jgi:hypothetical protein
MEQISIKLTRAPDDPPAHSPEFQEELRAFAQSLRTARLPYSQRGAVGYSLPEFFVTLSPDQAANFSMILTTWLQNQAGRAIRVTLVDDELDLQRVEDVESLIDKLKLIQDNPQIEGD